jgi:hypothetical protein
MSLKARAVFFVCGRELRYGPITAKKTALVDGLMEKANLISFLIDALPVAEKEEAQVCAMISRLFCNGITGLAQVARLATLESQMKEANNEYRRAVDRASPSCWTAFLRKIR